jgi:cell division septal protein FtsQ
MHNRNNNQSLKLVKSTDKSLRTKRRFIKTAVRILMLVLCLFSLKQGHALFTVKEFQVNGPASFERDDILEMSGIKLGSSIFLLKRNKAVQQLLTDPAILSADISSHFPSTVVITLNGRTPSAYILSAGDCWVVDMEGVIYDQHDDTTGSLPIVTGVGPEQLAIGQPLMEPARAEALKVFIHALAAVPDFEPSELNLTDIEELVLYTASGLKVLLGDSGKMKRKLILVRETLPYLSEMASDSCLDVRTGERLIVYGQASSD